MCITSAPAEMGGTQAFTYANFHRLDTRNTHVTGYQNTARNLSSTPNCMMLHFPGNHLYLVDGPQHTRHLMDDITRQLPALEPVPRTLGGTRSFSAPAPAQVIEYGDYHVVLAQNPRYIVDVIQQVPFARRPTINHQFLALVDWYDTNFPGYAFVLACFNGAVTPTHPIVVEYIPFNDDVLFVPGLDGHDGNLPVIGAPMKRDFRVAFGYEGNMQPYRVNYRDNIGDASWAPHDVTGFWDNRREGTNQDYVLPLVDAIFGLTGHELVAELIS